jgi:hypothetical protein
MRITVDYSEDLPHDHLIRNQHLQICFSIFSHLGWNGEFHERHFRSKLSSLALSLRNTVIVVSLASSAPNTVRATSTPLDEPGEPPYNLVALWVGSEISLTSCHRGGELLGWLRQMVD